MKKQSPTSRIIAGQWKGRSITLPAENPAIRPTRNQVLQAGFNLLSARQQLAGATVLDLFTGSGQWGLEAASRGAAQIVLVDKDITAAQTNLTHLSHTGADITHIALQQADITRWTPTHNMKFDVIFADPPYDSPFSQTILEQAAHWLKDDGFLLLEADPYMLKELNLPAELTEVKQQIYGKNGLLLVQKTRD